MNIKVVELEDGKITLKNSLRQGLIQTQLVNAWPLPSNADDNNERSLYSWVTSHVIKVEGNPWKPPTIFEFEAIEENYQLFLDSFKLESAHQLFREASALHGPFSDLLERPDSTLTMEQEADPNS